MQDLVDSFEELDCDLYESLSLASTRRSRDQVWEGSIIVRANTVYSLLLLPIELLIEKYSLER